MVKLLTGITGISFGKVLLAEAAPEASVITQLVREAPWAAALIVLCWLFLRYMLSVISDNRKMVEALSQEHLDARKATREAMLEVAKATQTNVVATQKNTDVLMELARNIERLTKRCECPLAISLHEKISPLANGWNCSARFAKPFSMRIRRGSFIAISSPLTCRGLLLLFFPQCL